MSILNQVDHCSLLVVVEITNATHERRELVLCPQMMLVFRLCFEVKMFDKCLELRRGRVSILQQVLIQVVLVVELSYFGLFIKLDTILRTPVSASDVLEQF